MHNNQDGTVKAVITTIIDENGIKSTSYETFKGEEAEVKAKIASLNISEPNNSSMN